MTPSGKTILRSFPIDLHWKTQDPFLFCAHHNDRYPEGNGKFGPDPKLLAGRRMGQDFEGKDGFRMYHGTEVPGFPVHPHRGFETITIVREGYADHADSLGAGGRYGQGDVQWMTAGSGIQHSEMFPLLRTDGPNPLSLFQIWLNLPKKNKMVAPHYKMLWSERIPRIKLDDGKVELTLIAGRFGDQSALPPPTDSWAADHANQVTIQIVKIRPGGRFEIPAAEAGLSRSLYCFEGTGLRIHGKPGGEPGASRTGFDLNPEAHCALTVAQNSEDSEVLLLQGKPIREIVAQYGPFVMNTRQEIVEAFEEYQRTQFGGWSWKRPDVVHGEKLERFAKFPDGTIERP